MMTRLFVLLLVFCFTTRANTAEVAGCLVYRDGNTVVAYNPGTGQKSLIAQDIADSFGISEDGNSLIILRDHQFTIQKLAEGKSEEMRVMRFNSEAKKPADRIARLGIPDVKQLALSPNGQRLAFAFQDSGPQWTPVGQFGTEFVFDQKLETFQAVTLLQTDSINRVHKTESITWFGNTAWWNPVIQGKVIFPYWTPGSSPSPALNGVALPAKHLSYAWPPALPNNRKWLTEWKWNPVYSFDQCSEKFTIRRNACFPTFSRSKQWGQGYQWVAVIYQTDTGFGPIELYQLNLEKLEATKNPGFCEIPVRFQSVSGMSFTPDGSLLVFADGNVVSYEGSVIRESMDQASFAPDNHWQQVATPLPVPANSTLPLQPKVVALQPAGPLATIENAHLCALDETRFLFLGPDNKVRLWDGTSAIVVAPDVMKGGFYYCTAQPPVKANLAVTGVSVTTLAPPANPLGKTELPKKFIPQKTTNLWKGVDCRWQETRDKKLQLTVYRAKGASPATKAVTFGIPGVKTLEEIGDPFIITGEEKQLPFTVVVDTDQPVLLRSDDNCIAISFIRDMRFLQMRVELAGVNWHK